MNVSKERSQACFEEIKIKTESVFVLDAKDLKADYTAAMGLLRENGIEALTHQKAFLLIDEPSELRARAKDRWFHIKGIGIDEPVAKDAPKWYHDPSKVAKPRCTTFSEYGELMKLRPGSDIDRRIHSEGKFVNVWPGENQLLLRFSFEPDRILPGCFLRFDLAGDINPGFAAQLVVGVRPSIETGYLSI